MSVHSKSRSRRQATISQKHRKVAKDDPGLTPEQVSGKAFGILRHEGKIGPRRKGGKK